MSSTKLLASILLVLTVLLTQVGVVAAAPQTQDTTPVTGTIQSITTETDANRVTTVLVTLMDDQGATRDGSSQRGYSCGEPSVLLPDIHKGDEDSGGFPFASVLVVILCIVP